MSRSKTNPVNPFLQGSDTIPTEVIDELVSRFLANIPDAERENPLRACFQIELAHWFFVDHYCGENSSPLWKERGLMPFLQFAKLMFSRSPSMVKQIPNIDRIVQEFKAYKLKVPVFGAILMNQELTKVVLVQGFSGTWGFPKGKINQQEDCAECAVREVMEETGYDCSHLLCREHFVESVHQERWTRLYFVRGVSPKAALKPNTRFEIKNIGWFSISELPENKKDTGVVVRQGFPPSAFHGVFPYIKRLRLWIDDKLSGRNIISAFKSYAPGRPTQILDRDSKVPLTSPMKVHLHDPFNDKTYVDPATKNFDYSSSSNNAKQSSASILGLKKLTPFSTPVKKPESSNENHSYSFSPSTTITVAKGPSQALQNLFGIQGSKVQLPNVPLQQMNRSSDNNFVKTNVNPKRRLFTSDDDEDDELSKAKGVTQLHFLHLNNGKRTDNNKPRSSSVSSTIITSPTWLNFKLDTEKIVRQLQSTSLSSSLGKRNQKRRQ